MGLGGYLAARTGAKLYQSELTKQQADVSELPEIFQSDGLSNEQISPILAAMKSKSDKWVDFMMLFELGL